MKVYNLTVYRLDGFQGYAISVGTRTCATLETAQRITNEYGHPAPYPHRPEEGEEETWKEDVNQFGMREWRINLHDLYYVYHDYGSHDESTEYIEQRQAVITEVEVEK